MWVVKEEGLHDRLPRWNLHNSVEPQPLTSQFLFKFFELQPEVPKKKKLKEPPNTNTGWYTFNHHG
jgi:hypothetical protein